MKTHNHINNQMRTKKSRICRAAGQLTCTSNVTQRSKEAVDMQIERWHLIHLKHSSRHCWQRQYVNKGTFKRTCSGRSANNCLSCLEHPRQQLGLNHCHRLPGNEQRGTDAIRKVRQTLPFAEPRTSSWSPLSKCQHHCPTMFGGPKGKIYTPSKDDTSEMMVMSPRIS